MAGPAETTESSLLIDDVDVLKHTLIRVMRSLVFRDDAASPLGDLPLLQVRCLYVLARNEGRKMQELADRMEIKLPAMSQIVDRLVKRGYVLRQDDPKDRRVVLLHLTEPARALLAQTKAARRARMAAAAEKLSASELRRVIEGLRLLADASEQVGTEPRVAAAPSAADADSFVEIVARSARARHLTR